MQENTKTRKKLRKKSKTIPIIAPNSKTKPIIASESKKQARTSRLSPPNRKKHKNSRSGQNPSTQFLKIASRSKSEHTISEKRTQVKVRAQNFSKTTRCVLENAKKREKKLKPSQKIASKSKNSKNRVFWLKFCPEIAFFGQKIQKKSKNSQENAKKPRKNEKKREKSSKKGNFAQKSRFFPKKPIFWPQNRVFWIK